MVILLITGPPGAGKEQLASFLHEKYGYHPLKIKSALVTNCWDFKENKPIESCNYLLEILTILKDKEMVLKETQEHINYALKHWDQDTLIYPIQFPESVESITKYKTYFLTFSNKIGKDHTSGSSVLLGQYKSAMKDSLQNRFISKRQSPKSNLLKWTIM